MALSTLNKSNKNIAIRVPSLLNDQNLKISSKKNLKNSQAFIDNI